MYVRVYVCMYDWFWLTLIIYLLMEHRSGPSDDKSRVGLNCICTSCVKIFPCHESYPIFAQCVLTYAWLWPSEVGALLHLLPPAQVQDPHAQVQQCQLLVRGPEDLCAHGHRCRRGQCTAQQQAWRAPPPTLPSSLPFSVHSIYPCSAHPPFHRSRCCCYHHHHCPHYPHHVPTI